MKLNKLLFAILFLQFPAIAYAKDNGTPNIDFSKQVNPALAKEIYQQDQGLFNAFNAKNAEGVLHYFSEDLEFYHDTGGLSNYQQNVVNTGNLLSREDSPTRRLISEDFEVHPIKDFGAIQTGSHQFCHMANGKNDCGTFKFLHIWKKTEQGWKITRVVSYDH